MTGTCCWKSVTIPKVFQRFLPAGEAEDFVDQDQTQSPAGVVSSHADHARRAWLLLAVFCEDFPETPIPLKEYSLNHIGDPTKI